MKQELFQQIRKRLQLNHKTAVFLLCVLLSTIFWVFTSLSKEYETHITVPVNYRNIPFSKYFDSELPKELDYHFKGSGFSMARVHLRTPPDSILVDVSAYTDNKKELHFQTLALKSQFPGELKPYKITPESITAGFSSRLSKKVPVKFAGQISYKQRFEAMGAIQLVPDSVELAGSPEVLKEIKEVRTTKLFLDNVSGTQTGLISIDKSTYGGLAISTSKIRYNLAVEEFTEGVIEIRVDQPVSQRNTVLIIPRTIKITFIASLSEYPQIKATDFRIEAEVPLSEKPSKLPVRIRQQPLSVRILKIEPELLDYLVQK